MKILLFAIKLLFVLVVVFTSLNISPLGYAASNNGAYYNESGGLFHFGNKYIKLVFRQDNGALWSIIHKNSGVDLKAARQDGWQVAWSSLLLTKDGKQAVTDSARSRNFTYELTAEKDGLLLNMRWRNLFLDTLADYPAEVTMTISLKDNSPLSAWTMDITNNGTDAFVQVSFPCISGITKLGVSGEDDKLVVPGQEGRLFSDPAQYLDHWGQDYPSGFANMQFMAYYDSQAGFYFASYDTEGYTKCFSWDKPGQPWAALSILYYPPLEYGSNVSLPYKVVVGVFDGDWHTAADIYKNWALDQWWAKEKSDVKSPSWLSEMALGKDFYTYPTGLLATNEATRTYDGFIKKTK